MGSAGANGALHAENTRDTDAHIDSDISAGQLFVWCMKSIKQCCNKG